MGDNLDPHIFWKVPTTINWEVVSQVEQLMLCLDELPEDTQQQASVLSSGPSTAPISTVPHATQTTTNRSAHANLKRAEKESLL